MLTLIVGSLLTGLMIAGVSIQILAMIAMIQCGFDAALSADTSDELVGQYWRISLSFGLVAIAAGLLLALIVCI